MHINPTDFMMLGKVLIGFFLGLLIGVEREIHKSPAGVRTYAAVCMGACVFGLASTHPSVSHYYKAIIDPTRIAAQVASGIGFIGAGVIFKEGLNTVGLTTAAALWSTAAIGLVVSFGMFFVAALTTLLVIFMLAMPRIPGFKRLFKHTKKVKGY